MFQFKPVRSLAAFSLTVLLLSCGSDGDKKADQEHALQEGMVMVDLSAYGKPFTVPVPDTTASPLSITEEQDGALSLRSGRGFGMSIYEQEADLKLKKDDIQADEVNRLRRMVREDKDGLIWESAITEPEHHFVCNRRLGGGSYSFSDIPGTSFSEDDVKTMFESALQATEKRP